MQLLKKKINVKTEKQLEKEIKLLENKLIKLYKLNLKNPKKVNNNLIKMVANHHLILIAYKNIQGNKRSLTKSVDEYNPVDRFSQDKIKTISDAILNETYQWKDIKQVMIPKLGKKKKRPLEIPTFSDKLIQECIRIILNIIYEPSFSIEEMNHGFRPGKGIQSAIQRIHQKAQSMDYALKGNISSAYNSLNHKILINLLKKKISDKKFIKLLELGLKQNIHFEEKIMKNELRVPQEAIVSPTLFNIYMYEFDLEIEKFKTELKEKNEREGRNESAKTKETEHYEKLLTKYRRRITRMLSSGKFDRIKFRSNQKQIEKYKKKLLQIPSKNKALGNLRIAYCRYADDWILFTNLKKKNVMKLKNRLTTWLWKNLKLKLDQEKTYITELKRGQAMFLGFSFFTHNRNMTRVRDEKTGKTLFRRRAEDFLYIGIDHKKIKTRMIDHQMINTEYKTRRVNLYTNLFPWDIVMKFRQKMLGFFNYYYPHLSSKADLSKYYYFFYYSCCKTIAYRVKKSITQIAKTHGSDLRMKYNVVKKDLKTNKIITKKYYVYFPEYKQTMNDISQRLIRNQKKEKKIRNKYRDIINNDRTKPMDPLTTLKINVNTRRTGSKIYKICCCCCTGHTRSNPIEMRHCKHLKEKVK